jgi:hypothetical protein
MAIDLQTEWITLTVREKIPALKNNRQFITPKLTKATYTKAEVLNLINLSRVNKPAPVVEQFILKTKDKLRAYMAQHGIDVIKQPQEVCVYLKLGVAYPASGGLPSSDDDNAYSTVQESLFTRIKEGMRGAVGPILEDDNQVADHRCKRVKAVNSDLIFSKLYVTLLDSEAYLKLLKEWDNL